MPTTPKSQMKLASDASFLNRLTSLLLQEAQVVGAELGTVPKHTERNALAQKIINNPQAMASNLAPTICNSTNLIAGNTTFDFEADETKTDVTDAAIRSQIQTLWNVMAGV